MKKTKDKNDERQLIHKKTSSSFISFVRRQDEKPLAWSEASVIASFCFIVLQNLVNLKVVDLSECSKLEEMPDLSKTTNLQVLILRHYSMLAIVNPSIFFLAKLEKLDLYYCRSLIILATDSHVCKLSHSHWYQRI
ncbi:Disease resistance protein RPP5, partial [Mucuna pruriens]